MDKSKRNIQPFDGSKYSIWKFRIRALLSELNIIDVIDNDRPEEINSDWIRDERKAKNIIIEYLGDSFIGMANGDCTARDILNNLDQIYQRKSLATQLSIRKRLLTFKLQSGNKLLLHFNEFDDLITELMAAGAKIDEMDKVSHLLLTLPSDYNGVITAIETLSEDNITLAFVKTRLLDQEIKLNNELKDTSPKVLNIQNTFMPNKRKQHMFKTNNNKQIKRNKQMKKCYFCGKKGHFKQDCFMYKRTLNREIEAGKTAQVVTTQPQGFAFMFGCKRVRSNKFIVDSGASDHLVNDASMFESCIQLKPPVKLLVAKNNTFINATKKGIVKCTTEQNITIILQDVLYSEEVPHCLLSVKRMQQAGMTVEFSQTGVRIFKDNKVILSSDNENGLPMFNLPINKVYNIMYKEQYNLWHQRLGHISSGKFREIVSRNLFDDVENLKNIKIDSQICEGCLQGKQSRLKYEKEKNKQHIKRPLYMIHTDVCGPITPCTVDNKNYYIIFLDDFTHYCVTYLLTRKSDAFEAFKDYVAKSEAHFGVKIVNLYCDNGREYLSNEMKEFCVGKGITYHLTIPYSPQQNGASERMIRYITEKARAMLHGAGMDKRFWGEAVLTATYLINRSPSRALRKQEKTPFELWHNRKPVLKFLRIFGSTAYVHNKTRHDKFESKSWKGMLVGYVPNGYKLWDMRMERFVNARDVLFDETNYKETRPVVNSDKVQLESSNGRSFNEEVEKNVSENIRDEKSETEPGKVINENVNAESEKSNGSINDMDGHESSHHETENNELRRSRRLKKMSAVPYNELLNESLFIGQSYLYEDDMPKSFEEIEMRSDKEKWQQAVKDELESHLENNTWTLVEKPKDKNIVDCKWVFCIKSDEKGNPIRYKARLVARGFTQQYLVDFEETFAPVARITSFRILIAFANQYNLKIHHMDVKTAFLNGLLKEDIYMQVPKGIVCDRNMICKLNKAIYGLKQAAKCWFDVFEQVLREHGFKKFCC